MKKQTLKDSSLRERLQTKKSTEKETGLRAFFETLFKSVQGYVEIRTIRKGQVKQYFYSDLKRLTSDLTSGLPEFKDTNVYFGVCPRNQKKGKEENVKEVGCVWIDLDCHNDKERIKKLRSLKRFNLRPSIIVNSGRGFHIYWLLDKVFVIRKEEEFLKIKGYIKGLSKVLGGDSTFDLARVLRVPGTINLKEPENPLPVKLCEFYPNRKITLQDLEPYWLEIKEATKSNVTPGKVPDKFRSLVETNAKIKDTWEGKRKDLKDQSRSGYDMALANLLIAHDFTDDEVASVLRLSTTGRGKDATLRYLNQTIGEARRAWDKKKEEPMKEERIEIRTGKEFNPRPYSNHIIENYNLKYDDTKRFWWYNETTGIWKDGFEIYLNDILRKGILKKKDLKKNRVNEIIADLEGLCHEGNMPSEPSSYLIPFKNKIYDLRNGKTLDFDPKYFFINKLAVNYNPENEECPNIDKLFREIVLKEDMITLYEIIAYCFFRDYPYPKAFMLYGNGANGKSTFTNVLAKVLGKENVSSVSLETLQSSPFGTSELYGKLANISPEMGYGVMRDTQTLKTLTGKDIIRNEEKFKKTSHFVNYAKMIFLGNEIPYSKDKSFAFYRRIFLLEFPNRFEIKLKADPFIVDRISEQEFEGLASTCLKILKDFTTEERLFAFTHHKKTDDVMEEYEKLSDPLKLFLDEKTQSDPDGDIPVRAFYDEFRKYQKHEKIREWNEKKIGSVMAQKGFIKKNLRVSTSRQGEYKFYKAFLELRWKDEK